MKKPIDTLIILILLVSIPWISYQQCRPTPGLFLTTKTFLGNTSYSAPPYTLTKSPEEIEVEKAGSVIYTHRTPNDFISRYFFYGTDNSFLMIKDTKTTNVDVTFILTLVNLEATPNPDAYELLSRRLNITENPQVAVQPSAGNGQAVFFYIGRSGGLVDNLEIHCSDDGSLMCSTSSFHPSGQVIGEATSNSVRIKEGGDIKEECLFPEPEIDISTTRLDFGEVTEGTSRTEEFTIRNTGSATLTYSISSTNHLFIASPANGDVPPSGRQTIEVEFSPPTGTVPGIQDGYLDLTHNDPSQNVPLRVQLAAEVVKDEPVFKELTISPEAVVGGREGNGIVWLDKPALEGGFLVALQSSDPSALLPSTVTIQEGETNTTFPIQTTPVPVNTDVTITATAGEITRTANLMILQGGLALQKLIQAGDLAPDGSIIGEVSGHLNGMVKGYDVNDAGNTVYIAKLENGQEGIFTTAGEVIALTGSEAPGGGHFRGLYDVDRCVSINNSNQVAFYAELEDEQGGIFTQTRLIAKEGKEIPGLGTVIRVSGCDIKDDGTIAFLATVIIDDNTRKGNIYAYSPASESYYPLISDGSAPGGGGLGHLGGRVVLRQDGTAVFLGTFVDGDLNGQGVFSTNGINYGRAGDIAPGGGGHYKTGLMQFNYPDANNTGEVVFLANLDSGKEGIFTKNRQVVIEEGPAPGGGIFARFSGSPSINDDGVVVFAAQRSDAYSGVFSSDGRIIALGGQPAYEGQSLGGAEDPLIINTGQVAYFGRVGGRNGLFITQRQPNTPVGINVLVALEEGIQLTFDQVDKDGQTTVEAGNCTIPAPKGFSIMPLDTSSCYDIQTSASFANDIEVCLTYDDTGLTDESKVRLFTYDESASAWTDLTKRLDKSNNVICGPTDHLSLFAIMIKDPAKNSIGLHLGRTYPQNNLNNSYDQGLGLELDYKRRLFNRFMLKAMLGFNHFAAKSSAENDKHWWNISGNFEYEIISFFLRPNVHGGIGAYIPKSGKTKPGLNAGMGFTYSLSPTWIIEAGGDYHRIFTRGNTTEYIVGQIGLVYQF